jgi:hypothetical protein
VARVTLHTVEPPAVHGHDGSLHINQVVFAHKPALDPFMYRPVAAPAAEAIILPQIEADGVSATESNL